MFCAGPIAASSIVGVGDGDGVGVGVGVDGAVLAAVIPGGVGLAAGSWEV